MKTRNLIPAIACVLALSAAACASGPSEVPEENTASTEQNLIAATGNVMVWPAGPILWDGLVGTWPISMWSSGAVGCVAFDMVGVTNLGVSLIGFPDMIPLGITTPWLNAFVPTAAPLGVAAPLLGSAGVVAPGFGGTFAPFVGDGFGFGFGASSPLLGSFAATSVDGMITPGFGPWLTPALSSSAFMFTNLVALDAFTPFTFNVTFMAQSAAQAAAITASAASTAAFAGAASLSIFATPIAATALTAGTAIPFTSIVYPVFAPIAPVVAPVVPIVAPVL